MAVHRGIYVSSAAVQRRPPMKNDWCYMAGEVPHLYPRQQQRDAHSGHGYHLQRAAFATSRSVQTFASSSTAYFFTHLGLRQQCRRIGIGEPCPYQPASRYSNTDRPCCVQVAITVQIRSHQRFPRSLLVPCVISRSITTKRSRLLRQVVGRLYSWSRNELEITRAMLLEPDRHVATVSRRRHVGPWHNSEP